MANKTFDWSALTRIDIYDHMQLIKPLLVKRNLPVNSIYKILSSHIRKVAPVRVYKKNNWDVPYDFIYVGGMYDSDLDQDQKKCIQVNLFFNPLQGKLKFTNWLLVVLSKEVADTILHEIIHMRQYRSRNFKSRPDFKSKVITESKRQQQCYLGNKDEIDAYSFNIACELYDKFGSNQKKLDMLLKQSRPRQSIALKNYLRTFDHDHSHPVIIELKKKVKNYSTLAEIGKPFKNNDWLNY